MLPPDTHRIATPRLSGRPLEDNDFAELCRLHRDELVVSAFGAEPSTDEQTREFLDRKLAHWRDHGFGIWMFFDDDGAFVGRCGIHRIVIDGRDEVELGYIVRSELWSNGYATEMAVAVAAHAFSALALPELVGFTLPDNLRSRRVLEKAGFVYERTFVGDGKPTVLYRLTAGS